MESLPAIESDLPAARWDLKDLFSSPNDPGLEQELDQARMEADALAADYYGQIQSLTPIQLLEAFQRLEILLSRLLRLQQYAQLLFATDTANPQFKALDARIQEASTKIENRILFFDLELSQLPENAVHTLQHNPSLAPYAYYIDRRFQTARYRLSEKEEQLARLKDLTGSIALNTLYEELTSSFRFDFTIGQERQTLNGEQLRALRQHADPDVRRRAMHLFLTRHQDHSIVITHCYNQIVRSFHFERELRGYPSALSVRNLDNHLSDQAVEALHTATSASVSLVQRYYRLKARLLRLPDMTLADIYAPLPQVDRNYSWTEAQDLVLAAFQHCDSDFYNHAWDLLAHHRIDAPVTPSKRGGAFCSSSVPGLKPFVMLNFTGRLRDLPTLAHELGHALHAIYSSEQNLLNYHAILPLAETASIFSEMLLTDHLLGQETDPAVRRALLSNKLEEMFATSHRQNMFSRFEQSAHASIAAGLLSPQELCALYQQELQNMFGDSVRIPPEYHWEWAGIPHIFALPFYVYAYNFAQLLVLALYQLYREQGADFLPRFKHLLAMGSSASPQAITSLAGVNIDDPQFWNKGLTIIERYLQELETLV